MTIHDKAAQGFQIAGDSYERGRPEYPTDALNYLVNILELDPKKTLVDIGAGTGKFTKLVLPSGAKIIAVEPVEGMRQKFQSLYPNVEILRGTAEQIPLPDQFVDAVIAAQAFHWFDGEKALSEIHRVLKPGGKLGLIWNARDEAIDWVKKMTGLIDAHEGGAPRYKSGNWRRVFPETTLFEALQYRAFNYIQRGGEDTIVDRVASISFISALTSEKKATVLSDVRQLLRTHPQTVGKTLFELPYRTDVFWTQKL